MKVTWQHNSSNPDNADNLAAIAQWWNNLKGKEITWQQRLIASTDNIEDINWETQKFDEKFLLQTPQLRGITVYWHKGNAQDERNITARKLELDRVKQNPHIDLILPIKAILKLASRFYGLISLSPKKIPVEQCNGRTRLTRFPRQSCPLPFWGNC